MATIEFAKSGDGTALPMVRVEKEYMFDGPDGTAPSEQWSTDPDRAQCGQPAALAVCRSVFRRPRSDVRMSIHYGSTGLLRFCCCWGELPASPRGVMPPWLCG